MSSFTWLDYSERERQQVMEVIDLFRDEDTRDELGIGTIRDTLADLLFPGTSTVQTRLRYFLFVPWVLGELERRKIASHDAPRWTRKLQGRLCDALLTDEEVEGVIGARAGQHVQRLPSNVYWNGLGVWGIRLYPGSEAAYYQSLDGLYERKRTSRGSADDEVGDDTALVTWDPALPSPPEELMEATEFELTEPEADYLTDRIRRRAPDSLLRELIDRSVWADDGISFPWDHSAADGLPPPLADTLDHARNFSELIHGAALLYNLMLAEEARWEKLVADYHDRLALWWDGTVARAAAFELWDQRAFWQLLAQAGGRITPHTRSFVDMWREVFDASNRLESLTNSSRVRQFVTHRERRLKGKRARLGNPHMLETWRGQSGTAQLDYRWNRPVKGYLNDLAIAFSGEEDHA